jgi:cell division protein FtsL
MSARIGLSLLVLSVLVSALGLVWVRYQARQQFVDLRAMESRRDALDIEWGQLQLEQSTWATHGRIERIAREQLGMRTPDAAEVVIVR